ncbi:stress protein, partial [bacterium]
MITLARGQKTKLADLTPALQISAQLRAIAPGLVFDFSCFGVDGADQLSDDRYFVFYNQKASPNNEIAMSGDGDFTIDLARLPATIKKLVFVITLDGNGTLSQLQSGHFQLLAGGAAVANFEFRGSDFGQEKAIIAAEIYLK